MAKVKMKTKKAVASRFKLTAKGKLKRTRPGRRHILTKKTSKRKRHLKRPSLVDKTIIKSYKRMLGIA